MATPTQPTTYTPYVEPLPSYQPAPNAYAQPEATEKARHSEPLIAPTDYESFKDASAAEAAAPAPPKPYNAARNYGAPAPVPGARTAGFTRTVLILHCIFLVLGVAQIALTSIVVARGQRILGTVDLASLMFLVMAIVSVLTDSAKIFWIAKRDVLPPRTLVLDILVIVSGLLRFIRVFYYQRDGLYGDSDASYRFITELWTELLLALAFFGILS